MQVIAVKEVKDLGDVFMIVRILRDRKRNVVQCLKSKPESFLWFTETRRLWQDLATNR